MRIAVVGGGPGGLLAAALIRESRPDITVDLFERHPREHAVGFGVVFSAGKLARLGAADPRLAGEVRRHGREWSRIDVRLKGQTVSCHGLGFSAIGRRALLDLLQDRADQAGVRLHFGRDVEPADLLPPANATGPGGSADHFDLVIGADGINSRCRSLYENQFEPTIDVAQARYIWFGADRALPSMTFAFERSAAGWFAAHAYPYSDRYSTFLIECDEATLRRAGLGPFAAARGDGSGDGDDEASRAVLQDLFAEHLAGGQLVAADSRWLRFRTLRVASWHHDRVVLLGDAAHTAHFSVGSGTTMALEDAIALAETIAETAGAEDLDAGLVGYERRRRPGVARIQDAAIPSLAWWEHFGRYADLEPPQFAVNFLTRSGRLSFRDLEGGDPEFGRRTLQWFDLPDAAAALSRPIAIGDDGFASRQVGRSDLRGHCPGASWVIAPASTLGVPAAVEAIAARADRPTLVVIRAAGSGPAANTAALLLGELVRLQLGILVALDLGDLDDDLAATHLLAGRADLIVRADAVADDAPDAVADDAPGNGSVPSEAALTRAVP